MSRLSSHRGSPATRKEYTIPVVEQLMGIGGFEIPFVEETPPTIMELFSPVAATFGFFGHVFVTPIALPTSMQTFANLTALARYTGIMRRAKRRGITGSGLLFYFGDENGFGRVYGTNADQTFTFANWVNAILTDETSDGDPFDVGTITGIGSSTLTYNPFLKNRRKTLDYVCRYFGGEYRFNPDNTVDAGPTSSLFTTVAVGVPVIITPQGGVNQHSLESLYSLSLEQETDFEGLFTRIILAVEAGGFTTVSQTGIIPQDLNGNDLVITRVKDEGATDTGAASTVAIAELTAAQFARRSVTLSADQYDIGGTVQAGDTVYVWDPENGLFDLTNQQIAFAGERIFPIPLRVYEYTWPIEEGMGVYYRISDTGAITDLTDYVAWESPGVSLVVGAPKQQLTFPAVDDTQEIIGRTLG